MPKNEYIGQYNTKKQLGGTNMIKSATFAVDNHDVPALQNIIVHLKSIGYCEAKICQRLGLKDLTEITWRALPIYRD